MLGEASGCTGFSWARKSRMTGTVTTTLPASPLSYEGVIVKVRWCLRVRVFFTRGRDFVSEHVFAVGDLPPARPAAPAARIAPPVPFIRGEPT